MKLPLTFKPIYTTDLIRVGRPNDGGYVIGKNSINNSNTLISFGLYDDWSFEKNFKKIKQDILIFVYDGEVKNFFWIKKLIKDTIYLFKNQINFLSYFNNLVVYFNYKKFFNKKNIHHEKKNIVSSNLKILDIKKENFTNLIEILKEKKIKDNFFLKIDIEGNEYEILDDIISIQTQLTGLVIEFHNCFIMKNHIEKFKDKINLDLVHLHINNYGETTKSDFPKVIEMTFSKRSFNFLRKKDDFNFPNIFLDQPNDPNRKDENIIFEN